jgi:predicted alpha-1,2-mannosidase
MAGFQSLTILSFVLAWLNLIAASDLPGCQQVNGFIATGGPAYGYGGINPGAQYPFGALRLGPDTTTTVVDLSFRHFSGYHALDDQIRGFSHTHLVGAGVDDLGTFGVMPVTVSSDKQSHELNFWWSKFQKESEMASPGYYSVFLDEPAVRAEILAISRFAAIHKYTWNPMKGKAGLVVDVCHAAKHHFGDDNVCRNATISTDGNTFSAAVSFHSSFTQGMWIYLYGEIATNSAINKNVKQWEMCSTSEIKTIPHCTEATTANGAGTLFGIATFGTDVKGEDAFSVDLRVGISFISPELAKQNLADAFAKTTTKNFNQLKQRTTDFWCDALSGITVQEVEGDSDLPILMHSANYRSLLSPTVYTESGGIYLGFDGQIHNATQERLAAFGPQGDSNSSSYQYEFFSDLSLWDTFRTLHPWMLLTNEDVSVGFARSMNEMTIQQSAFPRWAFAHRETGCMLGESGVAFIVDLISAGLGKEIDVAAIQKIFLKQSTESVPVNGRTDIGNYMKLGYVTQDASHDSTSETLTYAFDDYLLAKLSEIVGDESSAQQAMLRSKNYKNLWSSEKGFFCPRYASGEMSCPKSGISYDAWQEFREGDALHWMWFVPHDVEGLISLFPSPEAFDKSLSEFFTQHVPFHEKFKSAAPNPYYWAGNEHDFLAPFLFNYGPNCTNTQYWSREANMLHFSNTPHGVPGNEDYGSMSTWFLFSSLGFFPNTGSTKFLIGSPRVKEATVKLRHWNSEDSTIRVVTNNNSPQNVFVQKLLVNGVEYREPFIERSVLSDPKGVTLEFFMDSTPSSGLC